MYRCALRTMIFGLIGATVAITPIALSAADSAPMEVSSHWQCITAKDAKKRQQQVRRNLLPRVVFIDETKPVTLETRLKQLHIPALSVAVIRDGQLDWSAAWGKLQRDGANADCDTLFQAGSLAKPATVLAALRMQRQGLIDFDKNIDTYLSSWQLPAGRQTDSNPVTLRNLFAHTAGITPGGYDGYAQDATLPTDQQTVSGESPSNARKVAVLEAPNASLNYSGGGYTVAEIALQDELQTPFEQIMRTWLLQPVGMKQADFTQPLPKASHRNVARGHQADGTTVIGGWHNHPEQAAAGLWATASDLAALLIEIRKGSRGDSKIFRRADIAELLAKPIDEHAYGFRLIGDGEEVFITHYGGTMGYRAGMTLNLRSGDGAVYLSNSDKGSELGVEFLAAVARVYDWPVFREVQVRRVTQDASTLQSLTGKYAFAEQGWNVSIVFDKDALTIVFPNGDRYAMTPIKGAPLAFIHAGTGVRAGFEHAAGDVSLQLYGETGRRLPRDE